MYNLSTKIDNLVVNINKQFNNRAIVENTKKGKNPNIFLNTSVTDNTLWLQFTGIQKTIHVTIPLPFIKNGVNFIKENGVIRATCDYWLEKEQRSLDYLSVMYNVVCADVPEIISNNLTKRYPFLQQIIFSFENGNSSIIAHRFQRTINEIINRLPLHQTNLNSWVMNHRLIIIDTEFDDLRSPGDRLIYQVNKAKKYFSKGWTSIGLSDGTLADKNYILTDEGLRKLSPFGLHYHNPQRNLYATLGMQGNELPIVRSQPMQLLIDQGISRTGWNLFTLFADVPDVFEDQIIVDTIHKNKSVTYDRRFQIFGRLFVKVGDVIQTGDKLGVSPDDEPKLFTVDCDFAKVREISETATNVGGTKLPIYNVIVEYRQKFRDGVKLTNVHGNKGIIRLMDLGYAVDPRTGQKRKIDVIVGAKTVGKRKNYGQIMEAVVNCIIESKNVDGPVVLPDEWYMPIEKLKDILKDCGFKSDGTWNCETPYGKLYGVCGLVFWGCIKTPENQIWKKGVTTTKDNKNIRRAGLKFSHVEIRALKTRFGDQNPIIDEIMSYAQGFENLQELFNMVGSKLGVLPKNKVIKDITNVNPLDQSNGTIISGQHINNTIVDEFFMPEGFTFKLPFPYLTLININDETIYEGPPIVKEQIDPQTLKDVTASYLIDSIYMPNGILRKCWRHDSGKYGLSNIGVIVNNVVIMSHRLSQNPLNETIKGLYYKHLQDFFKQLSIIIGTKRGQLANYGMAVRYPFSVKAVATLSTTLPKNTIEIHRTMADQLHIKNNDISIVIRFPCLGFMSVRPQKIRVTDDIMCKYTIRVSGNSLVSQNLDFDGDVIYVASFHTQDSKKALNKEWTNPNSTCYSEIKQLNARKGAPHIKCYDLDDYKIEPFRELTSEEHAAIVEKNTGVKAQTGPIIALTYNIMRIVENSDLEKSQKLRVGVEMFLEKAAQSVFEQKHGGQSLHEIVIKSICTGDVESLVKKGFQRNTTTMIVNLIKQKARSLGITDLIKHHKFVEENNTSNIISLIVRKQNRIYFASRSELESLPLLKALNEPAVDVPSKMFKQTIIGRTNTIDTKLEEVDLEHKLEFFNDTNYKQGCSSLCKIVQSVFDQNMIPMDKLLYEIKQSFKTKDKGKYAETVGYRK